MWAYGVARIRVFHRSMDTMILYVADLAVGRCDR